MDADCCRRSVSQTPRRFTSVVLAPRRARCWSPNSTCATTSGVSPKQADQPALGHRRLGQVPAPRRAAKITGAAYPRRDSSQPGRQQHSARAVAYADMATVSPSTSTRPSHSATHTTATPSVTGTPLQPDVLRDGKQQVTACAGLVVSEGNVLRAGGHVVRELAKDSLQPCHLQEHHACCAASSPPPYPCVPRKGVPCGLRVSVVRRLWHG